MTLPNVYGRPVEGRQAMFTIVFMCLGLLVPLGGMAAYMIGGGMQSESAWRIERIVAGDPRQDARDAIASGDLRACAVWVEGIQQVPGISFADRDRLRPSLRGLPQTGGKDAESRELDAKVRTYADAYNRTLLPALRER